MSNKLTEEEIGFVGCSGCCFAAVVGPLVTISLLLATLKLTGVAAMSWLVVFLPLWFPLAVIVAVAALLALCWLVLVIVVAVTSRSKRKVVK
jgi:hypothetical protein